MTFALRQSFVKAAAAAAQESGHVFPEYAACEAALESTYGTSPLARDDNNLFGCKQHVHALYGTVHLPTREFLNHEWVTVEAAFVRYPDWAACFADRMDTLRRLAKIYPHYAVALKAASGEEFVTEVSKTWSTDPKRAPDVLAIYREFFQPET